MGTQKCVPTKTKCKSTVKSITNYTLIICCNYALIIRSIILFTYQNSFFQADVTNTSSDNDPFPINDGNGIPESHGTSCAGEIAMEKNNTICGVGVAYNSQITGVSFMYSRPLQINLLNICVRFGCYHYSLHMHMRALLFSSQ